MTPAQQGTDHQQHVARPVPLVLVILLRRAAPATAGMASAKPGRAAPCSARPCGPRPRCSSRRFRVQVHARASMRATNSPLTFGMHHDCFCDSLRAVILQPTHGRFGNRLHEPPGRRRGMANTPGAVHAACRLRPTRPEQAKATIRASSFARVQRLAEARRCGRLIREGGLQPRSRAKRLRRRSTADGAASVAAAIWARLLSVGRQQDLEAPATPPRAGPRVPVADVRSARVLVGQSNPHAALRMGHLRIREDDHRMHS